MLDLARQSLRPLDIQSSEEEREETHFQNHLRVLKDGRD